MFITYFFWYQLVCKGSTYQGGGGIITSFMNSSLPQRCLHSRTFPNIGVRRFLPDRDRHRRNPWNRVHIHIGHSDNRKSHNLYWIRIEDGVKYSGAASNTASTNSACTVLVKVIRYKVSLEYSSKATNEGFFLAYLKSIVQSNFKEEILVFSPLCYATFQLRHYNVQKV